MYKSLLIGSSGSQVITTMVFVSLSFLILMWAIKKVAWGPITNMFEQRAEKISSDIDGAEQAKSEAEELAKAREAELKDARKDAAQIVRTARKNSEVTAKTIVTEAREEAHGYKEKADKEIAVEREHLITEAKKEVADLSVSIAERIMKKELDRSTHDELINFYIDRIGITDED